MTKRLLFALFAFTLLMPLSGCGCRRDCCGDRSLAPPAPCCPQPGPPGSGFIPSPAP